MLSKRLLRSLDARARNRRRIAVELLRLRALKRKDRLFFVTDGEEGAMPHVGTLSRGEFRRDQLQDLPLLRRGILRFVDENMVDSRIEDGSAPRRRRRRDSSPCVRSMRSPKSKRPRVDLSRE